MNYEEKTSIGTPDNGFGVYSPQTERCAIRISELFGRWSDSILRVAGWCKRVFVRDYADLMPQSQHERAMAYIHGVR